MNGHYATQMYNSLRVVRTDPIRNNFQLLSNQYLLDDDYYFVSLLVRSVVFKFINGDVVEGLFPSNFNIEDRIIFADSRFNGQGVSLRYGSSFPNI